MALKDAWRWFETSWQRERIAEWPEGERIEPIWSEDIFEPPQRADKRPDLLRAVLRFVRDVREIECVRRISSWVR